MPRKKNPINDIIDAAGAWLGGNRGTINPQVQRTIAQTKEVGKVIDQFATGGMGQALVSDAQRMAASGSSTPSALYKTAAVNLAAAAAGVGAATVVGKVAKNAAREVGVHLSNTPGLRNITYSARRAGTGFGRKVDAGGGNPLKGWIATGKRVVTRPATNIGEYVADTTPVKSPTIPRSGGTTRRAGSGQVYTPSGVYSGKDVFVSKPPLTENQIRGIVQGQITKQDKFLNQISQAGRRGAAYGIGAGAVGTLGAQEALRQAQQAVAGVRRAVSKARGGGTKKK